MKSRAARLEPAVDLAHDRATDALARLGEEQRRLAQGEHQLGELQRYRQEYAAVAGGESVSALLNRQQFVAKIDRAIVQQTREIARLAREVEAAMASWRDAHARESALASVVEHHQERERRAEERMEQADVDERSQYPRNHGVRDAFRR